MKSPFQKTKSESSKILKVGSEQPPVDLKINPTPVEVVEKFHKKLLWVLFGGCVAFAATIGALTTFHVFVLPLIG